MNKTMIALTMGLCVTAAAAEPLKIIGFETGGGITFQGATVGNYFTLEFAQTVAGPWTNWGSVCEQAITGTVMASAAPVFYRIRQTDGSGFPPSQWPSLSGDMVLVPGGTFTMGYTSVATPTHQVTLSTFFLSKNETSYALWYGILQWGLANGYAFQNAGREGHDGTDGAEPTGAASREPVTTVSWRDAMVWCNARSEKEGLEAVYTYGGTVIRDSRNANSNACDLAVFGTGGNGYRLPTEAEWEYAARYVDGWTAPGNYASGASAESGDSAACGEVAWYSANSGSGTHVVGTKRGNQLGLYDVSGNVWELCWDWYGTYDSGAVTNYTGPTTGTDRVMRGGAWADGAFVLSCAYRADADPSYSGNSRGFRCARGFQPIRL